MIHRPSDRDREAVRPGAELYDFYASRLSG